MTGSIAIIGTGPAGLMAAQAAAILGKPFSLFGLPDVSGHVVKSVIGGAQFLHKPVPTLVNENQPDIGITYRKVGTSEGYRQKVYGNEPVPFVSFDRVNDGETVPAWSLHRVYEQMWNGICGRDGHSVNALRITPEEIQRWLELNLWDLIICTLPRHEICLAYNGLGGRPHTFVSQTIHVSQQSMVAGLNQITYNGDPEFSWYRTANLGGFESTEWGEGVPENLGKMYRLHNIRKPLRHDCDCWAGKPIVFAGRYGEWRKGVLSHEAFITTAKALEELAK